MSSGKLYSLLLQKIRFSASRKNNCFRKICNNVNAQSYFCTTKQPCPDLQYTVVMEPDVDKSLDSGEIKHRKHPGIRKLSPVSLPPRLIKAVEDVVGLENISSMCDDVEIFSNQLFSRRLPIERQEVEARLQDFYPFINEEEEERLSNEEKKMLYTETRKKLHCELKRWKPADFTNERDCILYLLCTLASNYASVIKVFSEINLLLPSFKPQTFFDFGSGVGSATWAGYTTWEDSIKEYFCVDTSVEMNELCGKLLQDGETNEKILKSLYFRQFLPASNKIKYDLVVSAFSLLDLPSAVDRLRIVDTLWRKTNDILVLIEPGSKSGFISVLEARDFILNLKTLEGETDVTSEAHVLCPCPHEFGCPRLLESKFSPCTNYVSYLPLYSKSLSKEISRRTVFSYVVLRKGPKPNDHLKWPRVVKPIVKGTRHLHCHLCSNDGTLNHVIITKARHGRNAYRCAKASQLGDVLPITLSQEPKGNKNNFDTSEESNQSDSDESKDESNKLVQ